MTTFRLLCAAFSLFFVHCAEAGQTTPNDAQANAGAPAGSRAYFNTRCELVPADSCQWGDLRNRDLDGKDLSDSNFKSANLSGASLRGAKLQSLNLQTANAAGANFSKADLSSASFFAANAEGANFAGARLAGVNFTRANLKGANFRDAEIDAKTWLLGARLEGATWIDGRLCAIGSVGACN